MPNFCQKFLKWIKVTRKSVLFEKEIIFSKPFPLKRSVNEARAVNIDFLSFLKVFQYFKVQSVKLRSIVFILLRSPLPPVA